MIDDNEQFPSDEARECYISFPADMDRATWEVHFANLIGLIDEASVNFEFKAEMSDAQVAALLFATATARKARDVVIWTLSDDKVPTLLAALVDIQPFLEVLRGQAQKNIMAGVKTSENIRANGMLQRLDAAMKAFQQ